jgi:hypothetical protein
MEGLIEGRIVHYVLPDGRNPGEHRPAIIVKVWEAHRAQGTVNMQVFTDSQNDYLAGPATSGVMWATSVPYSEEPKPRTWHWPEKV